MSLQIWESRYDSLNVNGRRTGTPRKLMEHKMKQVIKLTILAVGAITAFASIPAEAQNQVCVPGRGCVRTTQAAYNACFELSQARGVSEQSNRGERWFIYQCLKGKIPKGSQ